jgi:nitric oxide reductase activation protein
MDAAKEAAIVLHETCNQLKIQHSVVGFTSLIPDGIYVTHYRVVDWNEKDGAKIASLQYESENRDGYSIRIAAGELEIRPEPVKLMIVLSDGMPADKSYHDNRAIADTIRAVRDAEKKGIKVIGIYFGGEEEIVVAQKIYNYLVFCKDINSLPTILGRVLKKAMLG